MAFTCTVQAISYQNDVFSVTVFFNDSATSWNAVKTYAMPTGTTQTQAVATITADGIAYKAALAQNVALAAKVGSVIVI